MTTVQEIEYTRASTVADGFDIQYVEAGAGPPVLVLHGLGGVASFPGVDLLTDRFRIISPQLPGLHAGDNENAASMRDVARTIRSFAEALDLQTFNVLAFAVAAKAALWLAADAGDQVDSLVLSSPVGLLPPDARIPLVAADSLRHQADGGSPPGLGRAAFSVNESRFVKRVFGSNRDPELEAAMQRLMTPVLVLVGREDYLVPPESARIYRELVATSHYVIVPGAGPLIPVQRPSAFGSVVGDFLTWRSDFIYSHETGVVNP